MEPFVCPMCGHRSSFDPWEESAKCPECGYSPVDNVATRRRAAQEAPPHPPLSRWQLLEELVSHWNGTYVPDSSFQLHTVADRLRFFEEYEWALGRRPPSRHGRHEMYVREYEPQREEILRFVNAYLSLRRREVDAAAQGLRRLTRSCPRFTDPWIWLSATTGHHEERVTHLSHAAALELTHPLARDALAVIHGRVSLEDALAQSEGPPPVDIVRCPYCGGTWQYTPGSPEVVCAYCGHTLPLRPDGELTDRARLMSDLRLERGQTGRPWMEAQDAVRCASCGAEVIMSGQLSTQCAFCGSPHVVELSDRSGYVQPEGLLPFGIDEQHARSAVREAQRSGLRGVASWLRGNAPGRLEIKAVYLPFYVFGGFVEVRTPLSTDMVATISDRPESRTDVTMIDDILLPAVTVPAAELLARALPFDLAAVVPYDARLLAGRTAALYNRDVEEVVEEAYGRIMAEARHRTGTIRALELMGESDETPEPRPWRVMSCTYELVLLPLWMGALHWEQEQSPVLVNGQTGKVAFRSMLSGL